MAMSAAGITRASPNADCVDICFDDGTQYKFHALWLRDACRDDTFVAVTAGERILSQTSVVQGLDPELCATTVTVDDDRKGATVAWSDGQSGRFESQFLRSYADVVAKKSISSASPLP